MQQCFYFPVSLEDAIAILRRRQRLGQVAGKNDQPIVGYTDRAEAVLRARNGNEKGGSREVCLVCVEVERDLFSQLFMGDMTHFGPCAKWLSGHSMELEPLAQDLITHHGRFVLEIVKA